MNNTIKLRQVWIGNDLDSQKTVVSLWGRTMEGDCLELEGFATRPFDYSLEGARLMLSQVRAFVQEKFPDSTPQLRAVMEATGHYSVQFAQWLIQLDPQLEPAIVNPRQMRDFARSLGQRGKNDYVDTRAIGRYGAERRPQAPVPRNSAYQQLRELMRFRMTLVEQRTQITNARNSNANKLIEKEQAGLVRGLNQSIKRIEKQAEKVVAGDEQLSKDVKNACQLCGVGAVVAMTLLGELGDLRNYEDSAAISTFCGLSCKEHKSGKLIGRTTISREGSPLIRTMLWMACLRAVIYDQRFKAFYEGLVTRGKHPRAARCATMRKIVCVMRALVVNDSVYDPTHKVCGKLHRSNSTNSKNLQEAA